jgi:acetyltransferase-like isoleucine patch superfamily enzyme
MENSKVKEYLKSIVFIVFGWGGIRRLCILKTLYYNFRLFPFKVAIRLPLFIHSKVKIYKAGKIRIEGKIKTGMIDIGNYNLKSQGVSKILNRGEIIFKGRIKFSGSTIIENTGVMIFDGETVTGEGTCFFIHKKITVGKFTRIGFNCVFIDTDYHYMVNVATGEIKSNEKEITIGKCCWIGSNTTLKKGAVLPDYTIAASHSLLVKNYTDLIPPYSIIGGMPAKIITSGYRRVYNMSEEKRLNIYFKKNAEQSYYIDMENTDLEQFCTDDALRY